MQKPVRIRRLRNSPSPKAGVELRCQNKGDKRNRTYYVGPVCETRRRTKGKQKAYTHQDKNENKTKCATTRTAIGVTHPHPLTISSPRRHGQTILDRSSKRSRLTNSEHVYSCQKFSMAGVYVRHEAREI